MTPKALQGRPSSLDKYRGFLEDFYRLSSCRGYNQAGFQPIPISEIAAYLSLAGISGEESRGRFLRIVQNLDQVFLNHYFKKQENKTGK